MRVVVGSDERTGLTDALVAWLQQQGHDVELVGPLAGEALDWPAVGEQVARRLVSGLAEDGIVCCWTGTGVAMAANKVPGIRAALCADAETARGARKWNDANILAMSLRLTSPIVAKEIIDAWFSASLEKEEAPNVEKVKAIEEKYNR